MGGAYLGIDVGLSGVRAAVVDADGAALGFGQAGGQAAAMEGDAGHWFADALLAARQAISEAGVARLDGVGVGALGPAPIVLDGDGEPLFAAPLFGIDGRAELQRQRLMALHGLDADVLNLDHALPKVEWLRESDPRRFARASLCVDVTGFVVGRLTGRPVMDRLTREYYDAGPVPWPVALPQPVEPDGIAGRLTAEASAIFGIAAGAPVAVSSIDSYVDIAGAGATKPGDAVVLAGTTLILGRLRREAAAAEGLRVTGAIGGCWFFGGWTSAFGAALDWASRAFRESLEGGPGLSPLLMLPYLEGERAPVWDASASGILLGLRNEISPEALFAAARDGIILSALDIAERVDRVEGPPTQYRACGGAFNAPHVGQGLADALGAAIEVTDCGKGRAAAMLGAAAVGTVIPRRTAKAFIPDPARRQAYLRRLAIYRELYAATAPLMKRWNDLVEEEQAWRAA